MIIDAFARFSNSQALAATAVSTNVIDLGIDGNVGIGEPMAVMVNLETVADDGDANETYEVQLQMSVDEAFTVPVEVATRLITAGAIAGSKVALGVPADDSALRYVRLNYVLGGTTPSVTLSAYLQPQSMIQNNVDYASGFTIS